MQELLFELAGGFGGLGHFGTPWGCISFMNEP
jgi:hypothetical protein